MRGAAIGWIVLAAVVALELILSYVADTNDRLTDLERLAARSLEKEPDDDGTI